MRKHIVYSTLLAALLIGCGGGSDGGSDALESADNRARGTDISAEKMVYDKNVRDRKAYQARRVEIENDDSIEKKYFEGTLFNGYIESSRICLDLNHNNICDYNEPLTTSNTKGEFKLKVPMTESTKSKLNDKPIMILASRGTDVNTNRKFLSFLKAPSYLEGNVNLTPLGTLAISSLDLDKPKEDFKQDLNVRAEKVEEIMKIDNIFDDSQKSFKANFKFQKTTQILSSVLDNSGDKQSLDSLEDVYENFNLSTSSDFPSLMDSQKLVKTKKAVSEAKKIAAAIEKIDVTDTTNRQSAAVLVDGKVDEALTHFRNSNDDFSSSPIDTNNLQDNAIRLRIKEIGLSDVTKEMIEAVKTNGLALVDLENLEKIKNITQLKKLADLLEKKSKANSKLFVLKSFISNDYETLKIYFSHPLSKDSQVKLSKVDEVKKIYTITGLKYELSSSSYDESQNFNTLTFKEAATLEANPQIFINALTLADSGDIYSRPNPDPTNIEVLRFLPSTGQKLVFAKGDDGSYRYGKELEYKRVASNGVISDVANLQWQDEEFKEGENDNLSFSQAQQYCGKLSAYGKTDWRLPNVKEAVTTTSLDSSASLLFKHYPKSEVIHVSTKNTSLDRTMAVNKDGQVANLVPINDEWIGSVEGKYGVRCVRDVNDGSIYPHKAIDNIIAYKENETSYDPTLKVMFQDEPYTEKEVNAIREIGNVGKFGDLQYAVNYCEEKNRNKFGGFENWRLPNANELFFSLDGAGSETYQNKIPPYGYYITSSSSYIGGARISWYTGNYYVRNFVDTRTRGFIRCVRDMDEEKLKTPKEVDAPATTNIQRTFVVDANHSVNITVPAEIFSPYSGIRLTQIHDVNITNIQYEITNMLDPDESFPTYKVMSIKKNGKNIDPKTPGYFDFWVEQYLVGNSYGVRDFKEGDKLELVVNNRLYDVTINMTIGNGVDRNQTTAEAEEVKAPTLQSPSIGNIQISQSGIRLEDSSHSILYYTPSSSMPEREEYNIVKDRGSLKIKSFEIISGNDDGIFEFAFTQATGHFSLRVKKDKLSNLQPKKYTLSIKAKNGKESNVIDVQVEIVKQEIFTLKEDVVLDLANAQSSGGYYNSTDGRLILFRFDAFSNYGYKFKLVKDTKGFKYDAFKFEGESENYEIVPFYNNELAYGIVVKDGKKRANEDIEVSVTATSKNGETMSSKATIKIKGATSNEPIVNVAKPSFKAAEIQRDLTDAYGNGQQLQGDMIDMEVYSKDTTLSIEPAGILSIGKMQSEVEPKFYLHVQDKSQLTTKIFNEEDTTKTFTITATNSKGKSELKVKVKLIIAVEPELKPLDNPISIYPASGRKVSNDETEGIIAIDPENIVDDKYNIVKTLGTPPISDLIIVSGDEGIFEYKKTSAPSLDIKVKSDKVKDLVENKTYTLKIQGTNGTQNTNTIDLKIKVVEQVAPKAKSNPTASLAKKNTDNYSFNKADDGRLVYFQLYTIEPSLSYPERINMLDSTNGFKGEQISFEQVGVSTNYEVLKYRSDKYGVFLKNGGSEVPEDLTIKVIGTYGNNQTKSTTTTLKITN